MSKRHQDISILPVNLLRFVLISAFLVFSSQSIAQETNNEEVKRLQRAIFIFNFAQQIGWPDIEQQQDFNIGVLGPDRTILDLQAMAQKRKIHNKSVKITRFQFVKEIKNVHVLYVNNKYSYDIHYLLNKVSGKKILLITEDYNFNASMINMVNVGNSFEYEINANRIKKEKFLMIPALKRHAVTSSEKWKRLYQTTEKTLNQVQEDKNKQETLLKNKEKQILDQEEKITNQLNNIDSKNIEILEKNRRINKLYTESDIQQKKYEEKVIIEKELEKNIQEQITFIKHQEEKIKHSNTEIDNQNKTLLEQQDRINEQEIVLDKQVSEINAQKKIHILLISVIGLVLGVSFFMYRGYLAKKKYNKELKRKNLEIYAQSKELESKNKELEQFAYIASHDLQEPLNTISSFIGLVNEEYGDRFDDAGKESMSFIKDASIRMKNLIDALLEYSRLGRSREYKEVDCNSLIDELKKDLKTVLEKTETQLIIDDLPKVNGSAIELRLLFQNLISNGIKFCAKGVSPEIAISCTNHDSSNEFWQFSVTDNGIGIPLKHQERIFAIFQRLHSRDQYEGTGIGLAHCKKIVEAHGGKIWLASEENAGSTFYFTIPITQKTP
ncbi:YfiR/HmsC family protein [Aquimarina aquimarini]|uniref:YfiR/HmsC family protein n=1 Tax=Aquimarina aquimarini TaxID=1191734 RepID=UPI000D5576E8|nr:YfiR/HmsC family protein [Aquimarina aquimarini]